MIAFFVFYEWKLKYPKKRLFLSIEHEWCVILYGIFDRLGLQFKDIKEEAWANEKKIFLKIAMQGKEI